MRYYILDKKHPERDEPAYWLKRGHGLTTDINKAHPYDQHDAENILRGALDGDKGRFELVPAGTYAERCEDCPGEPPPDKPTWRLDRYGDAAVTWACDDHIGAVLKRFIRKDRDVNKFTVTYTGPT